MAPHDGDASASRDPHGRLGLAVRPAVLQALLVLAGFLAWTSAWVALSSPSGAPAAGGSWAWRGALSSANQEWQEDFDLAQP